MPVYSDIQVCINGTLMLPCNSESEFWADLRSGVCLKSLSSSDEIGWQPTARTSSPVTSASDPVHVQIVLSKTVQSPGVRLY